MTKLRYLMCITFWVLSIIAGWVMSKERGGWIVFIGLSVTMTIATGQIIQYFKMKDKN
jgi:hypothetical protein